MSNDKYIGGAGFAKPAVINDSNGSYESNPSSCFNSIIDNNNNYKPDLAEVRAYAASVGKADMDFSKFMAFYDADNWVDEKGKPINWKKKVVIWNDSKKHSKKTKKTNNVNHCSISAPVDPDTSGVTF